MPTLDRVSVRSHMPGRVAIGRPGFRPPPGASRRAGLETRADIVSPGHVFPLIAKDGGVLVRTGHTEAAVDVARLAGLNPSGVIC